MEYEWVASVNASFEYDLLQDMKKEIKLAIRAGDLFLAWKLNQQFHRLTLLKQAE